MSKRKYHRTSKLSSYQWEKKYKEYKRAFANNKVKTGDPDAILLNKKDFMQQYRDQIGIKADRRAREIANQQFYNVSQKLASRARRTLEEKGDAVGFSTTEIRTMTTAEIADLYKDYGIDLNEMYWDLKKKGKSTQEVKHYISQNYFGSP